MEQIVPISYMEMHFQYHEGACFDRQYHQEASFDAWKANTHAITKMLNNAL